MNRWYTLLMFSLFMGSTSAVFGLLFSVNPVKYCLVNVPAILFMDGLLREISNRPKEIK